MVGAIAVEVADGRRGPGVGPDVVGQDEGVDIGLLIATGIKKKTFTSVHLRDGTAADLVGEVVHATARAAGLWTDEPAHLGAGAARLDVVVDEFWCWEPGDDTSGPAWEATDTVGFSGGEPDDRDVSYTTLVGELTDALVVRFQDARLADLVAGTWLGGAAAQGARYVHLLTHAGGTSAVLGFRDDGVCTVDDTGEARLVELPPDATFTLERHLVPGGPGQRWYLLNDRGRATIAVQVGDTEILASALGHHRATGGEVARGMVPSPLLDGSACDTPGTSTLWEPGTGAAPPDWIWLDHDGKGRPRRAFLERDPHTTLALPELIDLTGSRALEARWDELDTRYAGRVRRAQNMGGVGLGLLVVGSTFMVVGASVVMTGNDSSPGYGLMGLSAAFFGPGTPLAIQGGIEAQVYRDRRRALEKARLGVLKADEEIDDAVEAANAALLEGVR